MQIMSLLGYILWCCGSRSPEEFNFIQIGSGHTVTRIRIAIKSNKNSGTFWLWIHFSQNWLSVTELGFNGLNIEKSLVELTLNSQRWLDLKKIFKIWLKYPQNLSNHYPEHLFLMWIVLRVSVLAVFGCRFESNWKLFWN